MCFGDGRQKTEWGQICKLINLSRAMAIWKQEQWQKASKHRAGFGKE